MRTSRGLEFATTKLKLPPLLPDVTQTVTSIQLRAKDQSRDAAPMINYKTAFYFKMASRRVAWPVARHCAATWHQPFILPQRRVICSLTPSRICAFSTFAFSYIIEIKNSTTRRGAVVKGLRLLNTRSSPWMKTPRRRCGERVGEASHIKLDHDVHNLATSWSGG